MANINIGQLIGNNAVDDNFNPYPNIDAKYGPYATVATALTAIPVSQRSVGLTVGIKSGNSIQEYWFDGGTANLNLVVKNNTSSAKDGKTPIFTEASAATLEPISAATAEIAFVGNSSDGTPRYSVAFGIPRGATGATGATGGKGNDGKDGTVPNWKTFVFKQSTTKPDAPTGTSIIPVGWSDYPTSTGIWWMSVGKVAGLTGLVTEWATPIKATGEDGVAGKYHNFKYALSTESTTIPDIDYNSTDPGVNWTDAVPEFNPSTHFLWMTTAIFNDSELEGSWAVPVRISSEDGKDGQSGSSTKNMYIVTSGHTDIPAFNPDDINPGSEWSTTIDLPTGDQSLWMLVATINPDGSLNGNWQGPILMTGYKGADGQSATTPNWRTYVYKKSDTLPDAPTGTAVLPDGWSDAPDDSEGQWWQCIGIVNGTTGLVASWSNVIPVNGKDGIAKDGRFTEFRFALGTLTVAPALANNNRIPDGWTKNPPAITTDDQYLWMTKADITFDNVLYSAWEAAVRISGSIGPKGNDGPAGSDGNAGRDGVDGLPGVAIMAMYSIGTAEYPDATFDMSISEMRDITSYGWTSYIPNTTAEKLYIWCVQTRIKYADNADTVGTLESNWSDPFRLTGLNGLPGSNGKKGQVVYPEGIYDINKTYTTDEYKAPYVFDSSDGNFYCMNYIGSWKGSEQTHHTPSESVANMELMWVKFDSYDAIFAKIGIIANGLIGSTVFNGDWMFSQHGKDASGNASTHYENFNPTTPTAGSFIPTLAFNFKTGAGWLANRNIVFDDAGGAEFNGKVYADVRNRYRLITNEDNDRMELDFEKPYWLLTEHDSNRILEILHLNLTGTPLAENQIYELMLVNDSNYYVNCVFPDSSPRIYDGDNGENNVLKTIGTVSIGTGGVLKLLFISTGTVEPYVENGNPVANKWVDVFKTRVVNIGDFKMSGTNKLITKESSQL